MESPYRLPSPPPKEPPNAPDSDVVVAAVLVGVVAWLVFSAVRPHEPRGYDSGGGTHNAPAAHPHRM